MKIVIVGASFAGLSAALECRLLYPEAEVWLVDRENEVGFFPNALNWRVKGKISSWEETRVDLYHQVNEQVINWLLGWEMTACLADARQIRLVSQEGEQVLSYDYLILAMGGRQDWERQSADVSEKIVASKSFRQLEASLGKLSRAREITVLGAGQIGMEAIEALSEQGYRLRLIEAQEWPLAKYMDQEMTDWLVEELTKRQVSLHFSETVNQIRQGEESGVVLETLTASYPSDYLIMGTNFSPNTDVLDGVVALSSDGSVVVDSYLETSQSGVFAVGDLIQLPSRWFGQAYWPLINHAVLTGRLAAHNLLEKTRSLPPLERMVSSHLFGRKVTSVGLTEREAALWQDVECIHLRQPDSLRMDQQLKFKLVVSKENGRLLGGQLVSLLDHTDQMNVLSLAISQGLTAADLCDRPWICQPGKTALVPFLWEAAHRYLLKTKERK